MNSGNPYPAAGPASAGTSIWSEEPAWDAAEPEAGASQLGAGAADAPPVLTFEQLTRPPEPPLAQPAPPVVATDPEVLAAPNFATLGEFPTSRVFPSGPEMAPARASPPATAQPAVPAQPAVQANPTAADSAGQAPVPDWATLPPRAGAPASEAHAPLVQAAAAPLAEPETPRPVPPSASSGVGAVVSDPAPTLSVLHVGCGPRNPTALPAALRTRYWREVRLDANPAMQPDIVASITDMRQVADSSMDAVYSSHNLEHVYPHEAPRALQEFARVLKPDGLCLVLCPDLQTIGQMIEEGRLFEPIYQSPAGPIAPIDILYGHRASMAAGNLYMAHKGGFTARDLAQLMREAGFAKVAVTRDPARFELWALGFRLDLPDELVVRCQANLGIGVAALPAPAPSGHRNDRPT